MNSGKLLSRLPQRIRKVRERKLRERLTVFSVCVLIAVFLWVIIKLSGFYFDKITYPVSFQNQTNDKILAGYSDSTVQLRVNAKGFKLLNVRWFASKDPVPVNVSHMNLTPLEEPAQFNYYILSKELTEKFKSKIEAFQEVTDVDPDTIYFLLDKKKSRKLPVNPQLNINYKEQYQAYETVQISPDSVMVSGPAIMIDTMKAVRTRPFEKTNVDEDIHAELKLIQHPPLNLDYDKVNLNIDVEEFTEATVEIPVETKNAKSQNRKIKTFPKKVKVTFWVALKDYQKVTSAQFTACVNCQKLTINGDDKARVRITRFPSYVKNIRVTPQHVEYVIEKVSNED